MLPVRQRLETPHTLTPVERLGRPLGKPDKDVPLRGIPRGHRQAIRVACFTHASD